jgi:hypothetical protein
VQLTGRRADLVWCQPNGRPIGGHAGWDEWKALLDSAGIRQVRVHDARHTSPEDGGSGTGRSACGGVTLLTGLRISFPRTTASLMAVEKIRCACPKYGQISSVTFCR